MKKTILSIALAVSSVFAFAQTNADVVGEWYNAEKDAVITLFEDGETVSGKITWMKFPNDENGKPKTDPLNPDEKLRTRARMGMVMMSGFACDKDNVWDDGELYDPARWGQHYKPYGLDVPMVNSASTTTTAPAPKVEEVKVVAQTPTTPTPTPTSAPEVAETTTDAPKSDAADILAMIRSRKTD